MKQPEKVTKRIAVDIETLPNNTGKYWDPEFLHKDRGEALDAISALATFGCMNELCDFTICSGNVDESFITAECTQERQIDGCWTPCALAEDTEVVVRKIVEILDGYID